ncbi:MAG: hypothetical protein ACYDH5_08950 [Acidimicrobiales bacterium]
MSGTTMTERTATSAEVLGVADRLRRLAATEGLSDARVDATGTVIVHSDAAGYGPLRRFASAASSTVGVWVNVITDDVPAAEVPAQPL